MPSQHVPIPRTLHRRHVLDRCRGIAEREIQKVKGGRFVLPISDQTRGHGTHTWAAVWKQYLAELLAETAK